MKERMKDFQKFVFDCSIFAYKLNEPLVTGGISLDRQEDSLFFRVGLSIVYLGDKSLGGFFAWCSSVSVSSIHNKTLILYKKDWTPRQKITMANILNSVLDGVGDPISQFVIDSENILMFFRQLTIIERSLFS